MSELEKAAEKYLKEHPFTLAGLHEFEVSLIESGYSDAYIAGARWALERAARLTEFGADNAGLASRIMNMSENMRRENAFLSEQLQNLADDIRALAEGSGE